MPFFVERFVFGLSLRYHFFIGGKSLSLEHSFEVYKQPVVAGDQIWRTGCRSNSKSNSCNFAIVAIDLWHGPLSWWKSTFFFFNCGRFWGGRGRFLPSNVPIIRYNIRFWWFFFFQGNPKIRTPKLCLLMASSLVALDGFTCCCPLSWLPIRLQSEVVDPCFIYCHILKQKISFMLYWNSCKQHSESLMHYCFWSTVSKYGTHFEHSFLSDKCSCKMVNTLPSDIFNISHNSNLQSTKMSLWSFVCVCVCVCVCFSGTNAEFRRPECSASSVSVRPR